MANVWARHPVYTVTLFLILFTTFYLLCIPVNQENHPLFYLKDNTLASRLKLSHNLYNKRIEQRAELIQKFGPNPKNISLFPTAGPSYPPYTVWHFFPPAFPCPHEVARFGAMGDGGKWVCGLSRLKEKKNCVVYSFGINYESSFESDLLSNTDYCEIWGYDFSVKSFGPEISEQHTHRTHFHAFGLSGSDAHGPKDATPMYTLQTLLKMNNHQHIDILKIDIEGWEIETLTALLGPHIKSGLPLPFAQLQLEVHTWGKPFDEFLSWWEMLEAAGLRPFWTEPNLVYLRHNQQHLPFLAEYSFLNVKGSNVFIDG